MSFLRKRCVMAALAVAASVVLNVPALARVTEFNIVAVEPFAEGSTFGDAGGNETAGILLPEIAVPLGTYTSRNLYKAPYVEGELRDRDGTCIPFTATHADYVKKVADAAHKLVAARLLLQEDAQRLIERANHPEVRKRFGP